VSRRVADAAAAVGWGRGCSWNEKYNAMLTEMGAWKQMVKDYPNMSVAQVRTGPSIHLPSELHASTAPCTASRSLAPLHGANSRVDIQYAAAVKQPWFEISSGRISNFPPKPRVWRPPNA
jgi:hypothetical protein